MVRNLLVCVVAFIFFIIVLGFFCLFSTVFVQFVAFCSLPSFLSPVGSPGTPRLWKNDRRLCHPQPQAGNQPLPARGAAAAGMLTPSTPCPKFSKCLHPTSSEAFAFQSSGVKLALPSILAKSTGFCPQSGKLIWACNATERLLFFPC